MASTVFGVKIKLEDYAAPVTADATLGIYSVATIGEENFFSGDTRILVNDASIFSANELAYVSDPYSSEVIEIDYISGNYIYINGTLTNAYLYADGINVYGGSEIRLIQNIVSGLSENYASGLIKEYGIGKFTRSIGLQKGGNVASPGSGFVEIDNTSQYHQSLLDKGIYINGQVVQIIEFSGTTETSRWIGECEKPTWNASTYRINFKGGLYASKRSNILTYINKTNYPYSSEKERGQVVPASWGILDKAKFVRVDNYNHELTVEEITSDWVSHPGTTVFPIVYPVESTDITLTYRFAVTQSYSSSSIINLTDLTGKFVKVVDGKGKDQIRKIAASSIYNNKYIEITIEDYFDETLQGNETANANADTDDNQTWIKILQIERSYMCDTKKCYSYLDRNKNSVTVGIDIYTYEDKQQVIEDVDGNLTQNIKREDTDFYLLPQYAYNSALDGYKNKLDIDPKLSKGDTNRIVSYYILPITEYPPITKVNLNGFEFFYTGKTAADFSNTKGYGYYVYASGSPYLNASTRRTGSKSLMYDKDITTSRRYFFEAYNDDPNIDIGDYTRLAWLQILRLPEIPDGVDYDNAYLGLYIDAHSDETPENPSLIQYNGSDIYGAAFQNSATYIYWDRFLGDKKELIHEEHYTESPDGNGRYKYLRSLPDFYFSGFDTNNQFFYPSRNERVSHSVSGYFLVSGYKKFPLTGISEKGIYDSVNNIYILSLLTFTPTPITIDGYGRWHVCISHRMYEAAVILEKTSSIRDAIYANHEGRVFLESYGGRRIPDTLITNPIDIYETMCRLQNWHYNSKSPSDGWGKSTAGNALIKTSGTGSFDDTELAYHKSLSIQNQQTTYEEGYTDKIKRSLCRNFWLGSWVDGDGYECIKYIKKDNNQSATTISLEVLSDRKIDILEPNPQDIYTEPFVLYNRNYATGEYRSAIRIKNSSASEYSSDYVEGLSGVPAETLWSRCHALWEKTKTIEKPPDDMTKLDWIGSNDAAADSYAYEYLQQWTNWMLNIRIGFKTHYDIVKSWNECERFRLYFPHETNNVVYECLCTGLVINPNPPYICEVEAIVYRETLADDYYYSDTINTTGDAYVWQETTADSTEYEDTL